MWPKKFEIGKWYKAGNILLQPLTYEEEGKINRYYRGTFYVPKYTMLYVQTVDHWEGNEHVTITTQEDWGAYDEAEVYNNDSEAKYLYHDPSENRLNAEEIELPKDEDFQEVIKAIFELLEIRGTNIL